MKSDPIINRISNGEVVTFEECCTAWSKFFPLLDELARTPQDPEWHAEGNVGIHTSMVLDELQNSLQGDAVPEDRLALTLAALFHDIGKPLVTREVTIKGKQRISSPRHAEKGQNYLALRLPLLGISSQVQNRVLALVAYHHHPRKLISSDASRGSFSQLARKVDLDDLYIVEKADLKGRTCVDHAQQMEQLDLFMLQASVYELESVSFEPIKHLLQTTFPKASESFIMHAAARGKLDFENGVIQTIEEVCPRAYQLEQKTFSLKILCGPSGSGKSTWIHDHAGHDKIVSLDQLRENIAGKRSSQEQNGRVLQAAKEEIKAALRSKSNVIFDATNTRIDGRQWVIQLGLDYGAFVEIIVNRTSVTELKKRNRKRQHPVPEAVLDKQIEGFEWPQIDEAHKLTIID